MSYLCAFLILEQRIYNKKIILCNLLRRNNHCNSILAVTDENDKSMGWSPSAVNGMFQQLRSKCL